MENNNIKNALDKITLPEENDQRVLKSILHYNGKKGRYSRAKLLRVAVIAAVLVFFIGGSTVYAVMISRGELIFSGSNPKVPEKKTDFSVVFDDSLKIPMSEIKGKVNECREQIITQVEGYDMFSSQSPHGVEKHFSDYKDAASYVGLDRTIISAPRNLTGETIVRITGNDAGDLELISIENEYYKSELLTATACTHIFTEHYPYDVSVGATTYSDGSEGVDYYGESIFVNGKEFWVVNMDTTPFSNEWLTKDVVFQQDGIIYQLFVRYKEVESEKVEKIISEWMNAF